MQITKFQFERILELQASKYDDQVGLSEAEEKELESLKEQVLYPIPEPVLNLDVRFIFDLITNGIKTEYEHSKITKINKDKTIQNMNSESGKLD